ncbi:MAG: hypothetical protein HYT22_02430 [Candidatus Niyogibacteria bacterium]|nr:hypothetical protein [Candidatus Niyogibacteria bacterium]
MNYEIHFRVRLNAQRHSSSVLGALLFGSLREILAKKHHAKRLRGL